MNSAPRVFIDTNILFYAYSDDPKRDIAWVCLEGPYHISVQTLNEFARSAHRKLGLEWMTIARITQDTAIRAAEVYPLTFDIHKDGIDYANRYGIGIYDALQLSCAVTNGGTLFVSEDMHDGMVIEDRLTIRNPFA